MTKLTLSKNGITIAWEGETTDITKTAAELLQAIPDAVTAKTGGVLTDDVVETLREKLKVDNAARQQIQDAWWRYYRERQSTAYPIIQYPTITPASLFRHYPASGLTAKTVLTTNTI